jgi:hypothetical protein
MQAGEGARVKRLVVGLVAGALTALVLAGCSNGPSLQQGDCAVIGSDGSIHQVSCQHPPQPQIYYVAQVTTGSCTVTADNEVTQNGETLCLRQIYRGSNTSNISASIHRVNIGWVWRVDAKGAP